MSVFRGTSRRPETLCRQRTSTEPPFRQPRSLTSRAARFVVVTSRGASSCLPRWPLAALRATSTAASAHAAPPRQDLLRTGPSSSTQQVVSATTGPWLSPLPFFTTSGSSSTGSPSKKSTVSKTSLNGSAYLRATAYYNYHILGLILKKIL